MWGLISSSWIRLVSVTKLYIARFKVGILSMSRFKLRTTINYDHLMLFEEKIKERDELSGEKLKGIYIFSL